jgi:hypothetical protein
MVLTWLADGGGLGVSRCVFGLVENGGLKN